METASVCRPGGDAVTRGTTDGGLIVEAHAKINLTLEILGRRADGFHNLASVMQTVSLHDTVTLSPASDVQIECDDGSIPDEANLALLAARALRARTDSKQGARITLQKRIPVAAGLGGGSSDAAAVLTGLNHLWGTGLEHAELAEVAAEIGSDVPFFLTGGTALVQGRGEDVAPLPSAHIDWLVILAPEIEIPGKTAALFARVDSGHLTRGVLAHKLAGRIRGGGDTPPEFLFNGFDALAPEVFPAWGEYLDGFRAVGAREITLCGAGPAMFALAPSREVGLAWQLMLQTQRGWRAFLVRRWDPPAGATPGRSAD